MPENNNRELTLAEMAIAEAIFTEIDLIIKRYGYLSPNSLHLILYKNLKNALNGDNIRIYPFTLADISDTYISWLNDKEVNRYMEVRFAHQTKETVTPFVQSFYSSAEKYMWGIYLDSEIIGTATLYDINRNHQRGVIGIMIGEKQLWGKGYGTEVIKLITGFAFGELKLHKIVAGIVKDNQGSVRAFEKAGYKLEGIMNEHDCNNGQYVDAVSMGIINDT